MTGWDNLGRVVIPKEIRKTLKVKEGMPLEICADKEGGIILRKFFPFSEMYSLSEEFAQCIAKQTGMLVFITDREKVLVAAGYPEKDMIGQPVSHALESILDDQDETLPVSKRNHFVPVVDGDPDIDREPGWAGENTQICQIIRSNGQIIGAMIIQPKEKEQRVGEFEKKIAMMAAEFLGKQVSV